MKRILFIATGGTVASVNSAGGLTPGLSGDTILSMVPGLSGLCDITVQQLMNIDSTNMAPTHWLMLAQAITGQYRAYDGFVILHGTDTLAYTAAALSYLIQDSPKPIVLTGSQKPISDPFTDARLNIYQSLLYAIDPHSRNVSVVFNNLVICGTRVRKQRTISYNAFESLNFPPLATFLDNRIYRRIKDERPENAELQTYHNLNSRIFVLKLIPGISPHIFALLGADYDALILETFGIGGIPEYEEHRFADAARDWVRAGKTLLLTTQVPEEGIDLTRYAVGRTFSGIEGILDANDMTTEAIVAKMMWILGKTQAPQRIRELFYTQINYDRGE